MFSDSAEGDAFVSVEVRDATLVRVDNVRSNSPGRPGPVVTVCV
jgi:hypothetical protein